MTRPISSIPTLSHHGQPVTSHGRSAIYFGMRETREVMHFSHSTECVSTAISFSGQ